MQITIDALVARAREAKLTMKDICQQAGVAPSTVSRARGGADMKLGTVNKLLEVIERHERSSVAGV